MTEAQKIHTLLAEALRCLDNDQLVSARRKIGYADVLVYEMTDQHQADPAIVKSQDGSQATGSALVTPSCSCDLEGQIQALREALTNLVARIDIIAADGQFQSLFVMAYIHGSVYRGPNWVTELQAARDALSSVDEPERTPRGFTPLEGSQAMGSAERTRL